MTDYQKLQARCQENHIFFGHKTNISKILY